MAFNAIKCPDISDNNYLNMKIYTKVSSDKKREKRGIMRHEASTLVISVNHTNTKCLQCNR